MEALLQYPEFWIGVVIGALAILALFLIFLGLLGIADEDAELSPKEEARLERNSRPRWPGSNPNAPTGATPAAGQFDRRDYARTPRSELRSRPR